MIEVQHYTVEFCNELLPLLRKNWRESSSYEEGMEADPDFEVYKRLDAAGVILCLTLREDETRRLVGYCIYIVSPSIHHRTIMVGRGDVMYVEPGFRSHSRELLMTAEKMLKERGVKRMGWAVDLNSKLYLLLQRVGFYDDEIVVEKKL